MTRNSNLNLIDVVCSPVGGQMSEYVLGQPNSEKKNLNSHENRNYTEAVL